MHLMNTPPAASKPGKRSQGNDPCAPDTGCIVPPAEFVRLRYFFGQRLNVVDLTDEQAYVVGKQRFHNLRAHGVGILCGLLAGRYVYPQGSDPNAKTTLLRVSKGSALDPCGREIIVGWDQCIDVAAWFAQHPAAQGEVDANGGLHLWILLCYRECPSDPSPAPRDACGCTYDGCEFARIREGFELKLITDTEAMELIGGGNQAGPPSVTGGPSSSQVGIPAPTKTPSNPDDTANPTKTPASPNETAAATKAPANPGKTAAGTKAPANPGKTAAPTKAPAKQDTAAPPEALSNQDAAPAPVNAPSATVGTASSSKAPSSPGGTPKRVGDLLAALECSGPPASQCLFLAAFEATVDATGKKIVDISKPDNAIPERLTLLPVSLLQHGLAHALEALYAADLVGVGPVLTVGTFHDGGADSGTYSITIATHGPPLSEDPFTAAPALLEAHVTQFDTGSGAWVVAPAFTAGYTPGPPMSIDIKFASGLVDQGRYRVYLKSDQTQPPVDQLMRPLTPASWAHHFRLVKDASGNLILADSLF
jgi:hypothetical protein